MSPNRILLGIGLLFVSLCVFLFLAGVFFPARDWVPGWNSLPERDALKQSRRSIYQ